MQATSEEQSPAHVNSSICSLFNQCLYVWCSPQLSPQKWRVWPSGSAQFWWLQPRCESMKKILKCCWTSSTAWPGPTPAPLSWGGPGWTAWPERTSRMEICQRYEQEDCEGFWRLCVCPFLVRQVVLFDQTSLITHQSHSHCLVHRQWVAQRQLFFQCCSNTKNKYLTPGLQN